MSVQPGPTFKRYAANGVATVYAIPFLLLDAADLQITLNGVLVTAGFTLSGIGNPTSSCTFSVAPTGDLLFQQVVPFQRLADYQINGDFLAQTVNRDFDRLWLAVKQLNRDSSRALTVSLFEPEGIPSLPIKAARALKMLAFDADGNPITSNMTLDQIEQQPALALEAVQIATQAASTSASNASNAAASAALAQKWASNPEDNPVIVGFFSALHWAVKAAASAASAAGVLANAVLKTGAQTMAGPLTVTGGITSIPFNKSYLSAQQIISSGALLTLPHALGGPPALVQLMLICITAEAGYSIGHRVYLSTNYDGNTRNSPVVCDTTNIYIRLSTESPVFSGSRFDTGSSASGGYANANWRLVVAAWA